MAIYIFKRNKKTGRKTFVRKIDDDPDLARSICIPHNNSTRQVSTGFWLEWTRDKDYIRNK